MKDYKIITECRACGGTELFAYLDLTDQPPANHYHAKDEELKSYPLVVMVCAECYLSMLSIAVNPDIMYKNYAYVSGTSNTGRKYFEGFASIVDMLRDNTTAQALDSTPKILDIACNDGTQLDYFKEAGWDTYGVDPAENLFDECSSKGHKVICDYWNIDVARKMNTKFDAIVAQNVFAHTDDVMSFLLACKEVMRMDSLLYIQTSQSEMFVNNEFDTIYHEHLSFFNTKAMNELCRRTGLFLRKVFKTSIHGTSYVFVISTSENMFANDSNIEEAIAAERNVSLYNLATYKDFAKNAEKIVKDLKKKLDELKAMGYTTIGLGAAAKGMTVLNFGKIQLDYILDETPMKIGKYTPGMNIEIKPFEFLDTLVDEKIAFVPLAWNFYDEIVTKITRIRRKSIVDKLSHFQWNTAVWDEMDDEVLKKLNEDKYIKYFPKVE